MDIEPINEMNMGGLTKTGEEPPAEVVDAVLKMPEVQRDYPAVYSEAMELQKQRDDILLFMHTCEHCGQFWECDEKAARCPGCGNWHVTMSSRLKDSSRRIE